jgi:hypothetical protein
MELANRKVIHFNVTDHPTLEWTKQQIRNACFEEQPKSVLHNNNREFGQFGRPLRVEKDGKNISCRSAYDEWLWHCQVNGSKAIISPRSWQVWDPSLDTDRLFPIGKSPASQESVVNCFEVVATNPEQILN